MSKRQTNADCIAFFTRNILLINSLLLLFSNIFVNSESILNPLDDKYEDRFRMFAQRIHEFDTANINPSYERNIKTKQYRIHFLADLHGKNFTGNVNITFKVLQEISTITLKAKFSKIKLLNVMFERGRRYKQTEFSAHHMKTDDEFIIHFQELLKIGEYTLTVRYTDKMTEDPAKPGYFINSGRHFRYMFSNVGYNEKHYMVPVINEQNIVARFHVNIEYSGSILDVTVLKPGKSTKRRYSDHHQQNYSLISIGFGITNMPYKIIDRRENWFVYALHGTLETICIQSIVNISERIQLALNAYWPELSFPLDIVIIPDGIIARNFNGLIIYSQEYICNRNHNELANELAVAILDQLFGHTFTNSYSNAQAGLWVFKGAQLFFKNFIIKAYGGSIFDSNGNDAIYIEIFNSFRLEVTDSNFKNFIKMSLVFLMVEMEPIGQNTPLNILLYELIINEKTRGAAIEPKLNEFTLLIGDIIRNGNFSAQGMINHMGNRLTTPGFPILHINLTDYTLNITQTAISDFYKISKTDDNSNFDKTWWIPITYATSVECNFTAFKAEIHLKPDHQFVMLSFPREKWLNWLIINLQQTGYYRVIYDEKNWQGIITYLLDGDYKKIHVINRAKLIDDAAHLADAGILDYDILFGLMCYLHKETELLPWKTALNAVEFLQYRLLDSPDVHKNFTLFIKALFDKFYHRYSYEKYIEAEKKLKKFQYVPNKNEFGIEIGCKLNISKCVSMILKEFPKWTQVDLNGSEEINKIKTTICSGMKYLPPKYVRSMLDNYPKLQHRLKYKFAECFGYLESKHYRLYLQYSYMTNDHVLFELAIKSILMKTNGLSKILEFIKSNKGMIQDYMEESKRDDLMLMISRCINNNDAFIQFRNLTQDYVLKEETQQKIDRIINYNIHWKTQHFQMIKTHLSKLQKYYSKSAKLWRKHGLD